MPRKPKPAAAAGYGKPPKAHQFKPGCSGNPSGRKRGSRNFRTDLSEELSETIVIQEAGVAARVSKQRAFVKRLCAQALAGDPRAMAQLANLVLRIMPPEEDREEDDALSEADQAIVARYLARALGSNAGGNAGKSKAGGKVRERS